MIPRNLTHAVLLCLATQVSAHLTVGSLLPAGGETFKKGDVMHIHWVVEQEHSGGYQIAYSPAPGTWVVILDGIRNNGGRFDQPMDTSWKVPDSVAVTTTGRIRVWQKATGEPGNTQAPDSTTFYALVSTNFSIASANPILAFPANAGAFSWNRIGRTLSLRMEAFGPGHARLSLFDGSGHLWLDRTAAVSGGWLRFEIPESGSGVAARYGRILLMDANGGRSFLSLPGLPIR